MIRENLDAALQLGVMPRGAAWTPSIGGDCQQVLVAEVAGQGAEQAFHVSGLALRPVVVAEVAVVVVQIARHEGHVIGRGVDVAIPARVAGATPFVPLEGHVLTGTVIALRRVLAVLPRPLGGDESVIADRAEVECGIAQAELEYLGRGSPPVGISRVRA